MATFEDMLDLAREFGEEYASTNPGHDTPLRGEWIGQPTTRTVCDRVGHPCTDWNVDELAHGAWECDELSDAFEDAYYSTALATMLYDAEVNNDEEKSE